MLLPSTINKKFSNDRSSHPHVFLEKGVLKTCSKFTEHPCRSAISIKLLCSFVENIEYMGDFKEDLQNKLF